MYLLPAPPPHMGRNRSLERVPSSPAKKCSRDRLTPSGKTNRPMVSADRWGSRSWATRFPASRGSALSPAANPFIQCSSSEEIAVTTTEKLDSSAPSPSIVPSAEHPVRGAPPVVSRTACTKERWSYPIEPNMKTKSGLATPAFFSACSAASRPATLGLWCRLMPTPALVVMGVLSPARQDHLSLGGVARHLLRRPISPHHRAGSGGCLAILIRSRISGQSRSEEACVCGVQPDQCHRNPL